MVGELTVTRTIGGEEIVFKKLTTHQRNAMLTEVRNRQRLQLLEDLETVGAVKEERLAELQHLANQPLTDAMWIEWVRGPFGRERVIRDALLGQGIRANDLVEKTLDDPNIDVLELIAELCHLRIVTTEEEKPPADTSTYGEPGTGPDPTPEESYPTATPPTATTSPTAA